jgi:hypothetical protein
MDEPPQIAALPHYSPREGIEPYPVPWIAIWEGERDGPEMILDANGNIQPAPGTKHVRREFGMWVIATRDNRTGAADFGSTQSRRQRECMTRMLCQVCGRTQRQSKSRHLWVVPNEEQHRELWQEDQLVLNAPVCPSCLEFSEATCPHLIHTKPYVVSWAPGVPVAITGDLHYGGEWLPTMLPLRHRLTARVIGRELVVRVGD